MTQGYATNQQLAVRTVGRFLLAVLTIRGFVSMRPTDDNIYDKKLIFTVRVHASAVLL